MKFPVSTYMYASSKGFEVSQASILGVLCGINDLGVLDLPVYVEQGGLRYEVRDFHNPLEAYDPTHDEWMYIDLEGPYSLTCSLKLAQVGGTFSLIVSSPRGSRRMGRVHEVEIEVNIGEGNYET